MSGKQWKYTNYSGDLIKFNLSNNHRANRSFSKLLHWHFTFYLLFATPITEETYALYSDGETPV